MKIYFSALISLLICGGVYFTFFSSNNAVFKSDKEIQNYLSKHTIENNIIDNDFFDKPLTKKFIPRVKQIADYFERNNKLEKAIVIYKKLTITNDFEAYNKLIKIYTHNLNDCSRALFWLNKAIKAGSLDAQFMQGQFYFYGNCLDQSFENAYKIFKELPDSNDTYSLILADMYFEGLGVPVNYKEAYRLYAQNTGQGNHAKQMQGFMLKQGLGVEKDLEKALNYFDENFKAYLFYLGDDVTQDIDKSSIYLPNETAFYQNVLQNTKPSLLKNSTNYFDKIRVKTLWLYFPEKIAVYERVNNMKAVSEMYLDLAGYTLKKKNYSISEQKDLEKGIFWLEAFASHPKYKTEQYFLMRHFIYSNPHKSKALFWYNLYKQDIPDHEKDVLYEAKNAIEILEIKKIQKPIDSVLFINQNNKINVIVNSKTHITLKKEAFSLGFYNTKFNVYLENYVNITAILNKKDVDKIKIGKPISEQAFFGDGRSYALDEENVNVFVHNTNEGGHHKLMDKYKFKNIEIKEEISNGMFLYDYKIETFNEISITDSEIDFVYLVVFRDKNNDKIVDSNELNIIALTFET